MDLIPHNIEFKYEQIFLTGILHIRCESAEWDDFYHNLCRFRQNTSKKKPNAHSESAR